MLQLLPTDLPLVEAMLTTKMLGILFWEAYQNLLIPTIITQTTIAITTIIEVITIIIATTTVTVAAITVIITIILPTEVTTLRQIDYNANLLYESLPKEYF